MLGLIPVLAFGMSLGMMPSLKMDPVQYGGRWILLLRDCGRGDGKSQSTECEDWETRFAGEGNYRDAAGRNYYRRRDSTYYQYPGDAAHFRQLLAGGRYEEVWLVSGGGAVAEGLALGRAFREHGLTVRVPGQLRLNGVVAGPKLATIGMCASSCTIAFMGGLFRYVDPGAPFLVHSASAVMTNLSEDTRAKLSAGALRSLAIETQQIECLLGLKLIRHFQNGLLQLVHRPAEREDASFFNETAQECRPAIPYPDSLEASDKQRYALEGIGAGQDIIMRIERNAMRAALDYWKSRIGTLGPRAGPALRMIEAMYDVAIVDTSGLTEETLIRMGYVTQDAVAAPPSRL